MAKDVQTLQTADRALTLIELLADTGQQMSVKDISRALGTSRTATYALLNSLLSKNFIEKDPVTKNYYLGFRMLELGARYRYQHTYVAACERGIYSLARKWRFQINLSIYKDPDLIVFLLVKTPEDYARLIHHVVMPAHITSGGKLLLSTLDDKELRELIDSIELKRYARNTIVDKEQLYNEILKIREQKYATEREENHDGRGCIAFPIYDGTGSIKATLSMVIPISVMDQDFDRILNDIRTTSREISQELGYNPYA